MLTITSKLQLNDMRRQKSDLEFEMMVNSNKINMYANIMGAIESQTGLSSDDLKDEPEYRQFVAAEDALEERNTQISHELSLLDEDIKSFQSYHQTGVKNDTSFWCFGG